MNKWEVDDAIGVIIIVHGTGEHIGRYKWLINRWNEKKYHVIGGNLPGSGPAKGRKGHIQSFLQYVETVASWYEEASKYNLPIFLLGHSLGGLIVIRAAIEKSFKLAGIILSSPCLKLKSPPPLLQRAGAKLVHRFIPTLRADSKITFDLITRNKQLRDEYEKDPLIVSKVSVRWYRELEVAMKKSFHDVNKFPNIPLLILQAGEDLVVDKKGVEHWFTLLKNDVKIYKEWPHLYHEVFNEPERDEVFAYTVKFTSLFL